MSAHIPPTLTICDDPTAPHTAAVAKVLAYSYIRFSSKKQADNDSVRRQTEDREKWLAEHPEVVLAPERVYKDFAVSQWQGKAATEGALKGFLDLCTAEKIPRGSRLIIESLDRLSRQQVFDAAYQFLGIIRAGVQIVTLKDGYTYGAGDAESAPGKAIMDMIYGVMIMSRANEESEQKSDRILKVKADRRADAATGKSIGGMMPHWLRPATPDEKTAFVLGVSKLKHSATGDIVEKDSANIVREVADLREGGMGQGPICRYMKRGRDVPGAPPVPAPNRSGNWWPSSVSHLLRNRSTIGELHQGMNNRTTGNKRKHIGEPVKGYYPVTVPPDQFDRIADILHFTDLSEGKSRQSLSYRNLFSRLTKCGLCDSSMVIRGSKNLEKRKYHYLVCNKRAHFKDCSNSAYIRIDLLEAAVLSGNGLGAALFDASDIVANADLVGVQAEVTRCRTLDANAKKQLNNIMAVAALTTSPAAQKQLATTIDAASDQARTAQANLEAAQATLRAANVAANERGWDVIAGLIEDAQKGTMLARATVAQALRKVIDKIVCHPDHTVDIHAASGAVQAVIDPFGTVLGMLFADNGRGVVWTGAKGDLRLPSFKYDLPADMPSAHLDLIARFRALTGLRLGVLPEKRPVVVIRDRLNGRLRSLTSAETTAADEHDVACLVAGSTVEPTTQQPGLNLREVYYRDRSGNLLPSGRAKAVVTPEAAARYKAAAKAKRAANLEEARAKDRAYRAAHVVPSEIATAAKSRRIAKRPARNAKRREQAAAERSAKITAGWVDGRLVRRSAKSRAVRS